MTRHFIIRIFGQVHGMMFRQSARDKAEALGVRGFVRNDPDGSVYIEAESDEDALNRFVAWCKKGPAMAQVDSVEVTEGEVKKFLHFDIV
ncbi:MAG: acylphosphatase [Candidatus Spechtbacterales bacterium]